MHIFISASGLSDLHIFVSAFGLSDLDGPHSPGILSVSLDRHQIQTCLCAAPSHPASAGLAGHIITTKYVHSFKFSKIYVNQLVKNCPNLI